LGAYLAVLVQVGVLGAWPLLGGQPHLIALGAVVFLVGGRLDLGAVWLLLGGGLIDLLLPTRFGFTLLPLVIVYGLLLLLQSRSIEAPNWLGVVALGLLLLVGSEMPLVILTGDWVLLLHDLVAGTLILIPIAWFLMRRLDLRRHGLIVR
jgi:hypothetical protein